MALTDRRHITAGSHGNPRRYASGVQIRNRDLALEFLDLFSDGNIDALSPLLHDDRRFRGPLIECDSKQHYLSLLHEDPPEPCSYDLLSVTETNDDVSMYYRYRKAQGSITIAHLFRFHDQKIIEILLVFDTRQFSG